MDWKRSTSSRFEKPRSPTTGGLGPGSYDLPMSTLDAKGVPIMDAAPERWPSEPSTGGPGPGDYDPCRSVNLSRDESSIGDDMPKWPVRRISTGCLELRPAVVDNKENRAPTPAKVVKKPVVPPRPPSPGRGCVGCAARSPQLVTRSPQLHHRHLSKDNFAPNGGASGSSTPSIPTGEVLKTPRQRPTAAEQESAAQAEFLREESRKKQMQLQAKDRKMEELQKHCEELMHEKREVSRRLEEAEEDRDKHRRCVLLRDEEMEQERKEARRRMADVEADRDKYRRLASEREQEGEIAAAELRRLRRSSTELEERLERQRRETAAEASRLADAEEDRRRRSEERLREAEERSRQSEERMRDAEAALRSLQERTSGLEQDLEEARVHAEALQRRLHASDAAHAQGRLSPRGGTVAAVLDELEGERRARRAAEAEARAAAAELSNLKEWADEQQLRELLAETHKFEDLKRVRDDITRQVEDARQEVADENRDLRQRLAEADCERIELRMDFDARRLDFEVAISRGEEERRALEVRASRTDAARAVLEEELAEERERHEARERELRGERHALLAADRQERESAIGMERKAAQLREQALEASLRQARSCLAEARWQLLVDAVGSRQAAATESERDAWTQVRRMATQWRDAARCQERDASLSQRQCEEFARLEAEVEQSHRQSGDLLLSLQQTQQELQSTLLETRRLQELEEMFEGDGLRASDHKQKIQYLAGLKAENISMRDELRRVRQQSAQTEIKLQKAHMYSEVLSAAVPPGPPPTSGSSEGRARTPKSGRQSSAPTPASSPGRRGAPGGDTAPAGRCEDATLQRERAEVARQARYHRRAADRAVQEFLHMAVLVEQVLALRPASIATSGAPCIPVAAASAGGKPVCDVDVAAPALLKGLRELAASWQVTSQQAPAPKVSDSVPEVDESSSR